MFISASAGPIFASSALTLALIASILSTGLYFAVLRQERLRITERRHVIVFFVVWIAALTFEFYFLGPYSFIEQTTEGNLNVTLNYYLSHGYDGGKFSHQYGGGQDVYTLLFGKHFFNPDRFLIWIFPLWIAILLHKVLVGSLGFIGGYVLARHVAPGSRAVSVGVAALFTVSHFYLLNWSTNWSPGFAILPLVIYLSVARSLEPRYWPGVLLAALMVAPSDPIHVFPPLAVAIVASGILLGKANVKR
ncbi:MAG: hypothetical protein O3A85_13930, partial [Proteobacteria bacterium]|nr:hypothetical protein [Pseudomonadota bacterium]